MCGLIYIEKINPAHAAAPTVKKRYLAQQHRGSEGFGYVAIGRDMRTSLHRAEVAHDILDQLSRSAEPSIMFHHRMPTSTPNVLDATHPIIVSTAAFQYDYAVIHNGMISNCNELRTRHIREKFVYTTDLPCFLKAKNRNIEMQGVFNDSEAVAIEFSKAIESGAAGMPAVDGSMALIALQMEKRTGRAIALYYCTDGSMPLHELSDPAFFQLTSQGNGKNILSERLFRRDCATRITTEKPFPIGSQITRMGFNARGSSYHGTTASRGYDPLLSDAVGDYDEIADNPIEISHAIEELGIEIARLNAEYMAEAAKEYPDEEEANELDYQMTCMQGDIDILRARLSDIVELAVQRGGVPSA